MRYVALPLFFMATVAFADTFTIGPNGIDSEVTGLDGSGILIGQSEPGRPGKAGYDGAGVSASNTIPAGVYRHALSGMDPPNSLFIDEHATEVAGVMIGNDSAGFVWEGVAPNAQLHAIAHIDSDDDVFTALSFNRLALLSGGAIRATNSSWGRELQPFIEEPDGNSHIAQYVDWSARRHDVLYVFAWGNADSPEFRTPGDNFNGMTVAASVRPMGENVFRKFSQSNNVGGDASGERTSIDLIAPGDDVRVLGWNDQEHFEFGTSIAAPHVTGTAALLHHYAERQIGLFNERFFGNPQKHEVMKAVMLNSADKLAGVHGSTRRVIDENDMDWTQSEAYTSAFLSLDDQLGAGHLNARRAVEQLAPGEYGPGTVPMIGWDYGSMGGTGDIAEYVLSGTVAAEQYRACNSFCVTPAQSSLVR